MQCALSKPAANSWTNLQFLLPCESRKDALPGPADEGIEKGASCVEQTPAAWWGRFSNSALHYFPLTTNSAILHNHSWQLYYCSYNDFCWFSLFCFVETWIWSSYHLLFEWECMWPRVLQGARGCPIFCSIQVPVLSCQLLRDSEGFSVQWLLSNTFLCWIW